MGLENLQYEDNPERPQSPQDRGETLDPQISKKMSDRERDQVASGRTTIFEIRRNAQMAQKEVRNLLNMATTNKRLTQTEVKKYEGMLRESESSADKSKDILEQLQKKIADIERTRSTDINAEVAQDDPDLLKAYAKYDQLVEDNEDILGTNQVQAYKEWIRQQKLNIPTLQDLTVKFLQGERPPRVKALEKLTDLMKKYDVDPLDVKYIKEEGLSERKEFAKNIEAGEKHFQKLGGMKDELYSKEAEKKIMGKFCRAENPQEQKQILDNLSGLSREEAKGYTTLKAAVQGQKISQKSMENITSYYKDLDSVEKRADNLKLWESFVQAEAKLTDKLQDVFNKEPANKEGFAIAFKMFKDMDYAGKEEFIKKQQETREQEKDQEQENKKLTVDAFKHACTQAVMKKTISASTEKNYHDWIEKNSKDKSYAEVKKFHETLTSNTPNEQYKNLKAYEKRREKFQEDMTKLKELNPTITEDKIADWENKYDKEGWRKREEVHKELKAEIKKAQESRIGRLGKLNPKLLKKLKEGGEEDLQAVQNKETALAAIQDLIGLKAYGTAMKHCIKLLKINPADEDVLAMMEELAELADQSKVAADQKQEQDIYDQYSEIAKHTIVSDAEISAEAKEIQSQEIGLELARKDQSKKQSLSAKDRNKREVLDAVKHDSVLTEMAEDYMDNTDDSKILDAQTLGGKDVIQVDFQRVRNAEEKTKLRRQIYTEQVKADKHGGLHHGSTAVEFKDIHTQRVLDAREGKGADLAQQKDKEDLSKKIAKKVAAATSIKGADENTGHLKLAREAALDEINKKAHTRIETMAKAA